MLICLVVLKMWERRGNDRKGKRDDFCDLVVLIGLQAKLGKERHEVEFGDLEKGGRERK